MKCTDPYKLGLQLQAITAAELRRAIAAHGGRYDFPVHNDGEDDVSENPVIVANLAGGPATIVVTGIRLDEAGLHIIGNDQDDTFTDEKVEYTADDFFPGQLGYITELIPATEDVSSVTLQTGGNLDIDPDILCFLTMYAWPSFRKAGTPEYFFQRTAIKRSEELTIRWKETYWNEKDFTKEMKEQADILIREELNPKFLRLAKNTFDDRETVRILESVLNGKGTDLFALAAENGVIELDVVNILADLIVGGFLQKTEDDDYKPVYAMLRDTWAD